MTMAKPDCLFLTQRLPYPPIKGEKIRPLQILRHIARTHRVHLGCLIDDPDDRAHIATMQALCADLYVADINRRRARFGCLRGLLTGEALSVRYFRHSGLAGWVRDAVHRLRPPLLFVSSSNMAPYVLDLPRTGTRIVDLTDVDSEKWRAYADTTAGPMRLVYRREAKIIAALERRIAGECDISSFVSEAEADLFRALVPEQDARVRGISNGTDHGYFDPASARPAPFNTDRANFVFTGTMDYKPNVDAVCWFANAILPLIRARVPDAQFHIVGHHPSPAVRALAHQSGVFVTGRVPDVRPFLAHATAAVAPLLIARGIQNKVLEAMAMARPVIVTPCALEGIDALPGQEVVLADGIEAFAAAAIRLAIDGDVAGIGAAARARIVRDYGWPARLRQFDDVLGTGVATYAAAPAADGDAAELDGATGSIDGGPGMRTPSSALPHGLAPGAAA